MVRLVEASEDTLRTELSKIARRYGLIGYDDSNTGRTVWSSIYSKIWYDPTFEDDSCIQMEFVGIPGFINADNIEDLNDIVNDLSNSQDAIKDMLQTYSRLRPAD